MAIQPIWEGLVVLAWCLLGMEPNTPPKPADPPAAIVDTDV